MAHHSAPSEPAAPAFRPDRTSPVPLYYQVATHLERAIESGAIPAGTLLGNEIQLADEMGLSRPTMRRAMQALVDKGLIVRRRGIGTRVVQPKVRRSLELTSLYDDLASSGQEPTTVLLSFHRHESDEETAASLQIEPGAPVVRLERLRSAHDQPIAKLVNVLPGAIVDFDSDALSRNGLYELLRLRGIQLHAATQSIGARPATAAEARLLNETRGASLLTMTRTTFDDRGRVVELGTHLYAASRYAFEIDLLAP